MMCDGRIDEKSLPHLRKVCACDSSYSMNDKAGN